MHVAIIKLKWSKFFWKKDLMLIKFVIKKKLPYFMLWKMKMFRLLNNC